MRCAPILPILRTALPSDNRLLPAGLRAIVVAALTLAACSADDECVFGPPTPKESNICKVDTDCKYTWFTGGCYTPEYVTRTLEEAKCEGRHIGEASPREGITCTCEVGACVTHAPPDAGPDD